MQPQSTNHRYRQCLSLSMKKHPETNREICILLTRSDQSHTASPILLTATNICLTHHANHSCSYQCHATLTVGCHTDKLDQRAVPLEHTCPAAHLHGGIHIISRLQVTPSDVQSQHKTHHRAPGQPQQPAAGQAATKCKRCAGLQCQCNAWHQTVCS